MKRLISILIVVYVAYLVFTTSCANPGMPTGGDKDTIPPVVVKTMPEMNARNYTGKAINLTFDEFIIADEVSNKLVVSPPLKKKPVIKTKSKTLIIELGENMKPNTTYSLDFKDALVDNNEKNALKAYRFSFSNGADFDSLEIGGFVRKADNMEPMKDILILLHATDSTTAFRDSIPNYIARTDEEGFYRITNIAAGSYRLYALDDTDNSLTYNQAGEMIAFHDSLIIPQIPVVPDSILTDSLKLDTGNLQFSTQPYYLLLFGEKIYDQYLDNYKRDRANLCNFIFTESVTDSFQVNLLAPVPSPNWSYIEYNPTRDSLKLWINDTIISQRDTLKLQLKYQVQDSLKNLVTKADTISLMYSAPVQRERKRRETKEKEPTPLFSFKLNTKDGFDIYNPLRIEAPEPLAEFDWSKVLLFQLVDSLEEKLPVQLTQDTSSLRKFVIDFPWKFEEQYRLQIDSAAAKNFAGHPSNAVNQKFKIQKEGFYAKVILMISNLPGTSIVQLLKNTDKEEVVQQIMVRSDGEIEFPYLKPEKFKIRLIVDRNENGRWDTGKLDEWSQPERVVYYPKILKLRSNFEIRESWDLPADIQFKKELIDEDQKDKDAKKPGSKRSPAR